ncbi:ROK family protein [Mucilaginibacter daejeonensis]|uniref:ROK family protein n=1 Tax=Mucilaginibacter daejeonensis TaxID=398049 RepID=UPI001D1744E3|nr:ROK family protein [Mucilaginibacter daejeonensis]UEG55187.1 ROK family protein [Mucilaginibacter daejeonensis]
MRSSLSNYKIIGVDIGGSHITAAQVVPDDHTIMADTKVRLKVDAHADADTVIGKWAEALCDLCDSENRDAIKIGIAMPGPFNYNEGISLIKGMNKYESLYGMNVRKLLSEALGIEPDNIVFRNDAEAFLHGEVTFGKVPFTSKAIGITLGTGLGSAVSINGITNDVFRAINKMHDGIAEDYISTRWFQKRCLELSSEALTNVEALLNHQDTALKDQIFNEFGTNLGFFLNAFAVDEQADVIIIGGNIAKSMDTFMPHVLNQFVNKDLEVRQSVLWEDAALIGAACSWPTKTPSHIFATN